VVGVDVEVSGWPPGAGGLESVASALSAAAKKVAASVLSGSRASTFWARSRTMDQSD